MFYYVTIGIIIGFVLLLAGYRIFRKFRPAQVSMDKMAHLTQRAAETVYQQLRRKYRQTVEGSEDYIDSLARAVCDELFGRVDDWQVDQGFWQKYRCQIDDKLSEIKHNAEICKIVSQAAHIMGMVKYASSASGRADEQYRSFEYKSVSLNRLNELGIDTARYMPKGKSLYEHYKAFGVMVRKLR